MRPHPSSAAFFEAKYRTASNGDPWNFETEDYELQRYRALIQTLGSKTYQRAFEPGCSIGVLTEQLAAHCEEVEACDFSPTAVDSARRRCRHLPTVHIVVDTLTAAAPWKKFDLIVLCEIGYYFTPEAWQELVLSMVEDMRPATALVACHWLGHSPDHVMSGDTVHALLDHPLLLRTFHACHESAKGGFRLERWIRKA